MAGEYAYFYEDDGVITGHTHGCGCCSNSITVGVPEMEEHISRLEKDLKEAKRLLRVLKHNKSKPRCT